MQALAAILVLGFFNSATASPANLTVETSNGPILGHRSSSHPVVAEYLGIPFAQPPVGELRFEPPRPVLDKRSYTAANYGFDCPYTPPSPVDYPGKTPQFDRIMRASFLQSNDNPQSEDCLTLNIWINKESATLPKPVLVQFHGGRWTFGTTNTPFYYGASLAASEDIIVITVNNRMNVFGFPGIPGLPPNLGLLDQRRAVEWIRDNIQAFGGDPQRITISGQSSGSAAVDYWAYAYAQDPIVAGLISHSGTAFSFPSNSQELSTQHWYTLSSLLGCGSSRDVLPCMKKQNVSDILAAAAKITPPRSGSAARRQPVFQPTVDGVTVFEDYETLSRNKRFARIPYLVGHTDNEAGFYKIPAYAQGVELPDEEWQAFNDETFTCPTDKSAIYRFRAGLSTWRFRYMPDWENTRLYPGSGAYHAVDMNMIFGNSELITGIPESPAETKVKRTMQKAWDAFVADPKFGLMELGWPQFDEHGNGLILVGRQNRPLVEFVSPALYNSSCAVV